MTFSPVGVVAAIVDAMVGFINCLDTIDTEVIGNIRQRATAKWRKSYPSTTHSPPTPIGASPDRQTPFF
jgi:hypothetical protein